MEHGHEQKIQADVGKAGDDEKIQGTLGVAHGPQDARTDVVHQVGNHAAEVDGEIDPGAGIHVLGRAHHPQGSPAEQSAHQGQGSTGGNGQGNAGVDGPGHVLAVSRAVALGDDDGGAVGQAHEKAHQQIDDGGAAAAHRGQGLLAHELAYDHRVYRIIKLLKKGSKQKREKEQKHLLPEPLPGCGPAAQCRHNAVPS